MVCFGERSTLTGTMRSDNSAAASGDAADVALWSIEDPHPERIAAPDKADALATRRNSLRFMTLPPIGTSRESLTATVCSVFPRGLNLLLCSIRAADAAR